MDGVQVTALTTLVGLFCWYLKNQTAQQSKRENDARQERAKRDDKHDAAQREEREFSRSVIKNELKDLADLNNKSLTILENHNGHTEIFSKKVVKSLNIIANRLNGGTAGTKAIARLKEIETKDRRKKVKKVEEERRK